jgi:hypothetical protein
MTSPLVVEVGKFTIAGPRELPPLSLGKRSSLTSFPITATKNAHNQNTTK